jgi:hypothetical protein
MVTRGSTVKKYIYMFRLKILSFFSVCDVLKNNECFCPIKVTITPLAHAFSCVKMSLKYDLQFLVVLSFYERR